MHGQQYHHSEFVLCGHQQDDLPQFGRICDIVVIIGTPLLSLRMYRTAPLLRPPPPFATYFQEKEGGGVTTRTCAFASQLSPPPLPRIRVLCSAVEDENSFNRHAMAVLKDGRVVGHVHVAKHSR